MRGKAISVLSLSVLFGSEFLQRDKKQYRRDISFLFHPVYDPDKVCHKYLYHK